MEHRKTVLLIGSVHNKLLQLLQDHMNVLRLREQSKQQQEDFLREYGSQVDAVVTSSFYGINAEQISLLPKLQVVCSFGVGYDSIDYQALKKRNIPFSNTPDVLNDCVADTAIMLWLAVVRQALQADQYVRAGLWEQKNYPLTPSTNHKKVAILGLGNIGAVIAKRVAAFDCEVAYHNRTQRTDINYLYKNTAVELAQWCDFLFVTTVGGAATRHLVDAQVLQALGPEGYLINVSRGSVVDQTALKHALDNNLIAGAGLDVFEDEPHIDQDLFKYKQLVMLPHIGSATYETRLAMADLVFNNLSKFFEEGLLISPVNC